METYDRNGARAVLCLKYGITQVKVFELVEMCRKGDLELVQLVVDAGYVDIEENSYFLLYYASVNGQVEVVKYLLDIGIDVHTEDDAALKWACYFGQLEVVKVLLEAGANVHVCNDAPLMLAEHKGQLEVVKLLKEYMNN